MDADMAIGGGGPVMVYSRRKKGAKQVKRYMKKGGKWSNTPYRIRRPLPS